MRTHWQDRTSMLSHNSTSTFLLLKHSVVTWHAAKSNISKSFPRDWLFLFNWLHIKWASVTTFEAILTLCVWPLTDPWSYKTNFSQLSNKSLYRVYRPPPPTTSLGLRVGCRRAGVSALVGEGDGPWWLRFVCLGTLRLRALLVSRVVMQSLDTRTAVRSLDSQIWGSQVST